MNTPSPTILIAGIGNIFLGDDAFGSEVARRLQLQSWPEGVQVVDVGIRGLDLAYALLDGHDLTILVDAAPRGMSPGTVSLVEPDLSMLDQSEPSTALLDVAHARSAQNSRSCPHHGCRTAACSLVACEPADLGGDDGKLGMTDAVRVAVDEAVRLIDRLVREFPDGCVLPGDIPLVASKS